MIDEIQNMDRKEDAPLCSRQHNNQAKVIKNFFSSENHQLNLK